MKMRKNAMYAGIAIAGAAAVLTAYSMFPGCAEEPQDGTHSGHVPIARESVKKMLMADDAAKREAQLLRQHRTEEQTSAVRLERKSLLLGGIAYGAGDAEVRASYGTPQETTSQKSMRYAGKDIVACRYEDGLLVETVDGTVRMVRVRSHNTIASGKGVRIGTPVEELRRVYGEPSMIYGKDYIYFFEEDPTVGFAFSITDDHVSEMRMGDLGL